MKNIWDVLGLIGAVLSGFGALICAAVGIGKAANNVQNTTTDSTTKVNND